jgi:5-deoxy-glucuronate isomerase
VTDLLTPADGTGLVLEVTPASAGWRDLGFAVLRLAAGQRHTVESGDRELAFVPQHGPLVAHVNGVRYELSRSGPFEAMPHVLYVPPGTAVELAADADAEIAWGSAPAEGRYPVRLVTPEEMRREVRGGGPAIREVHHVLAHPLPAERLIVFEVYVPGGAWSGWPPHCHDGRLGSAYLEETYYYRIQPAASGLALHRNYAREGDMDDVHVVRDRSLVQVRGGFHPVAAAPGSNVYFLNFLAGDLEDEARGRPPVDDPDHAWIVDAWDEAPLTLPIRFEGDDGQG